jgi:hypothetical protein
VPLIRTAPAPGSTGWQAGNGLSDVAPLAGPPSLLVRRPVIFAGFRFRVLATAAASRTNQRLSCFHCWLAARALATVGRAVLSSSALARRPISTATKTATMVTTSEKTIAGPR